MPAGYDCTTWTSANGVLSVSPACFAPGAGTDVHNDVPPFSGPTSWALYGPGGLICNGTYDGNQGRWGGDCRASLPLGSYSWQTDAHTTDVSFYVCDGGNVYYVASSCVLPTPTAAPSGVPTPTATSTPGVPSGYDCADWTSANGALRIAPACVAPGASAGIHNAVVPFSGPTSWALYGPQGFLCNGTYDGNQGRWGGYCNVSLRAGNYSWQTDAHNNDVSFAVCDGGGAYYIADACAPSGSPAPTSSPTPGSLAPGCPTTAATWASMNGVVKVTPACFAPGAQTDVWNDVPPYSGPTSWALYGPTGLICNGTYNGNQGRWGGDCQSTPSVGSYSWQTDAHNNDVSFSVCDGGSVYYAAASCAPPTPSPTPSLSTVTATSTPTTAATASTPTPSPSPVAATSTPTPSGMPSATQSSGEIRWHPHTTVHLAHGLTAMVDLADGHMDLAATDMGLPGRGLNLSMGQVWDSVRAQAGLTTTAGQGWSSSLSPAIGGAITGTLVFADDTGASWPLTYTGSLAATGPYTTYSPPPGMPWQLAVVTAPTTAYTLTNVLTGATMSFDNQGRYVATADAYGNKNLLPITSNPGPDSITNSGGRSIQFLYNTDGLLSDAMSPLWMSGGSAQVGSQHVAYGYTPGTTQLRSITTQAGTGQDLTTTFGYSGTQLVSVTVPSGRQWTLAYDALGRVASVTSPASGTITTAPGYTPAYTTAFSYIAGQTVVVEGFGSPHPVTTTYTLDAQGEPIAIQDALGNQVSATYDADHGVLTSQDANHHTVTNHYQYVGLGSTVGLLTKTDRPAIDNTGPVTTRYTYDPQSYDLRQAVSGNGGVTYYTYDGHHAISSTIQQIGAGAQQATWRAQVNQYDQWGELIGTTDGRGVPVAPTTGDATPVASVDPTLSPLYTRGYTYTAQGDLRAAWTPPITTTPPGGSPVSGPVTTTYGVDADGNVTDITSPNGAHTTIAYDHLGRRVATTGPAVALYDGTSGTPVARVTYDGDGNVSGTTDGAGDPTAYSYDPLGRIISEVDPVGDTTLMTYTATTLSAVQDPAGVVTGYGHDQVGRTTAITDGAGAVTSYGYDPVGNTAAITTPLDYAGAAGSTVESRTYDPLDELTADTVTGVGSGVQASPQTTALVHDHDGNVTGITTPNGGQTFDDYDLADRPTGVDILPVPGTQAVVSERFTSDAADNVTDMTDFAGRDHSTLFDGANRPTQRVDLCLACAHQTITTTAAFDPDGNALGLAQQTDGLGQTGAYTATDDVVGRLLTQDDGQGATSYGYDLTGDLRTSSVAGGSGLVAAALDKAGRATALSDTLTDTVSGSPVVSSSISTFGYDGDSLPLTATLGAGTATLQEGYLYYPTTERPHRFWVGSTRATTPLSYTEQDDQDPQGHSINVATLNQPANLVSSQEAITYTPMGQLSADSEQATANSLNVGREDWHYDGAGNLLNHTVTPPLGQPTSIATYSYAYPNPDGTIPVTPQNWLPNETVAVTYTTYINTNYTNHTDEYVYDTGGNTTLITSTYTGGGGTRITRLGYDAIGRVSTVTVSNTGQQTQVVMGYNARGLRDRFTLTKPDGTVISERMLYRGNQVGQLVVSTTPPMGSTTSYTETLLYRQGGVPLELLYGVAGQATQRYWYVVDPRGSVVALTDNAGNVVNRYAYDPWGNQDFSDMEAISETVPQPLRYRGYWYDGWIDAVPNAQQQTQTVSPGTVPWYALGVRYYDPTLERFLQPNLASGVPNYTYAHDDPHDQCDPTGLDLGCPQLHGQIIRGAPYDPSMFTASHNELAQFIGSLLLFSAVGGGGISNEAAGSGESALTTVAKTGEGSADGLAKNIVAATGGDQAQVTRAIQHFLYDEHILVDESGNIYRDTFTHDPEDLALLAKVANGGELSADEGEYLDQLTAHEYAESQILDTQGSELEQAFYEGQVASPPHDVLAERLRPLLQQRGLTGQRIDMLLRAEPVPMTPYRFAHNLIGFDYPNPDPNLITHLAPAP